MNAKRDENRITTFLVALNTDGKTPQLVYINSTNHALKVNDGNTGSSFVVDNASRDENRIPVAMGVSSADGITPIELYGDISGNLLIQTT